MDTIEQIGNLGSWQRGDGPPRFSLEPEPAAEAVRYRIVSVDDHLVEPPDLFSKRLPKKMQDAAPKVIEADDGREYWLIDSRRELNVGGNASVSQGPNAPIGGMSMRFDEMRPGTWNVHDRIKDMDLVGVVASLGFPSMVFGFCGQRFMRMQDADLGLACVRAYNDWVIGEWCAAYPARLISSQIPWLLDVAVATKEIVANAARGCQSVAFSENPEKLGLPSIHTGYWDPFLAACQETGTVVNLHVGSSSSVAHPSSDGPGESISALFAINSILATVDWLYSGIPSRFPELKIVLSEGGIGWVPMLLDRLDYLQDRPRTRDWKDANFTRSEVLQRNFSFASFYDPSMWGLIDRIGADRIMLETDYPHPDTTWPSVQSSWAGQLRGLSPRQVEMVTYENACRLYRHTLS